MHGAVGCLTVQPGSLRLTINKLHHPSTVRLKTGLVGHLEGCSCQLFAYDRNSRGHYRTD